MISASQARSIGRRMVRENAKLLLGSCFAYFGLAVAMGVVSYLVSVNLALSFMWSIGSMFLTIPLILGILHVFNMVYYKRSCTVGNLFDFFRQYDVSIKVVGISCIFGLAMAVILVPMVIVMVVPVVSASVMYGGSPNILQGLTGALMVIPIAFLLVAVLLSLLVSSIYMACYYIALRNRALPFGRLLGDSLKIGFRYLWKYFVFRLTFLGWVLLAMAPALLLTLASAFVAAMSGGLVPALLLLLIGFLLSLGGCILLDVYMFAASAAFYNIAIDEYEQRHPDSAGNTPFVPGPPAGGFRVAEEPPAPPAFPPDGESAEPAAVPEEPVEHVEAEVVAEQGLSDHEPIHEVVVMGAGFAELSVARVISDVTELDITQAMALLSRVPATVRDGLPLAEARRIAKLLTDAGAKVEIR